MDPALIEDPYPLQRHLGFRITGWRADWARFEIALEPFLMNRYGIPHGGIYATMLDTVMGYAGCYTGDPAARRLAMTLTLTTSFLARPEGELLIAEGTRIGGGRSTFFAEAEVRDQGGMICAKGSGAFRYRKTS
ncbi:phenylacetic acid degradation protein [Defluviimonas sp. 20V17]|nr:phenylacetic acid degradation protein [Defluviimonas sp. 20V17]